MSQVIHTCLESDKSKHTSNKLECWSTLLDSYNRYPSNAFGDEVWPPYEPIHRHYIEINGDKRNSYLKSGPRIKECLFWKPFFNGKRVSKHNELWSLRVQTNNIVPWLIIKTNLSVNYLTLNYKKGKVVNQTTNSRSSHLLVSLII